MPSFESVFKESKGKPISYEGKTLVMSDDFPTQGETHFRLVFEACDSEWRQGVALDVIGKVKVGGQIVRGGIVLWHDTAPQAVEFEIIGDTPAIQVKNVWDVGNGTIHSWHNGAAMIIELLPNGRRYRCNDGLADDDFDDVIFRIERVEKSVTA